MSVFSLLNSISPLKLSRIPRVILSRLKFSTVSKNKPLFSNIKIIYNQQNSRNLFRFKKATAEHLKIKDNVPDQYNLIYRNTMDKYLVTAQIISTSCALFLVLILLYIDSPKEKFRPKKKDQPKHIENETQIFTAFLICFCVTLQAVISKLPIRIYNLPQQDKYLFVFYRSLPLATRNLTCVREEVIKLEETGILPWKDSRYELKNKQNVILLEPYFRRPADLNILLGYQKNDEAMGE